MLRVRCREEGEVKEKKERKREKKENGEEKHLNITSGHVVLIRRGCVLVWAKQGNVVGMQGEGRGVLAEVMGRGSAGEGKGGR